MKTLKELYRIGAGPSSSHTMAPYSACRSIKERYGKDARFTVELTGSLAHTGKGHGTDIVILRALGEGANVIFNEQRTDIPHPNTMYVHVQEGEALHTHEVISLGGGAYSIDGVAPVDSEVYPYASFKQIKQACEDKNMRICDVVYQCEPEIKDYLATVWQRMKESVEEGLAAKGVLPGVLKLERKAGYLYGKVNPFESSATTENMIVCAYAFAVAEQNASGGVIVTAPTCGASGVLPACLVYMQKKRGFSDGQIIDALATAGIIGNLIKQNASISGAECGCQAEIGSACSMASAALAQLHSMTVNQIECAAEVAMEHYLGLTCDPVAGLVQIPCIERNAVAAMRAINALSLARFLTDTRKISFDTIVSTMYKTGLDMSRPYKETSMGGLAAEYDKKEDK